MSSLTIKRRCFYLFKGACEIWDKSNYKADFIVLKDNEFEKTKFERRSVVQFLDLKIFIISAEDLLLSKLVWMQELQSSDQADDILHLSKLNKIDWPYIWRWVNNLKLDTFNLLKND